MTRDWMIFCSGPLRPKEKQILLHFLHQWKREQHRMLLLHFIWLDDILFLTTSPERKAEPTPFSPPKKRAPCNYFTSQETILNLMTVHLWDLQKVQCKYKTICYAQNAVFHVTEIKQSIYNSLSNKEENEWSKAYFLNISSYSDWATTYPTRPAW